jgi:putative tricarboxylic transport membrane protein
MQGARATRLRQGAVGVGVLLAGGVVVVGALALSSDAGYAGVGPNFLPLVVGGMLCLCGAWLAWEAATGGFREAEEPSGAAHGDWVGFALVSVGLLANALLITRIGFVLACTLCFVLAVGGFRHAQGRGAVSPGSVLKDAALGFAISAPVYWLFGLGLSISLPGLTSTGWL